MRLPSAIPPARIDSTRIGSPLLSRELLVAAIAYRVQEIAFGGLRPQPQRQLRHFAQQLKIGGQIRIHARPDLAPGTRLVREWQGRSYQVMVLEDGFSWQGTHYRSLSAIAREITGTPWSGPLFFGLKHNRSAPQTPALSREVSESGHAAG